MEFKGKENYSDPITDEAATSKDDINEEIANVDAKSAASLLAGSNF